MTNNIAKVPSVDLGRLPVGSVLAASLSGDRRQVDSQWASFTDAMNEFNLGLILDGIEEETCFVLPADLKTLSGDNITLGVARALDTPANDLDQLKQLRAFDPSVTNDSGRVTRGTLKLSFR